VKVPSFSHWHSLQEFFKADRAIPQEDRAHGHPIWIARVGLPFITLYSRFSGTKPLYTGES